MTGAEAIRRICAIMNEAKQDDNGDMGVAVVACLKVAATTSHAMGLSWYEWSALASSAWTTAEQAGAINSKANGLRTPQRW